MFKYTSNKAELYKCIQKSPYFQECLNSILTSYVSIHGRDGLQSCYKDNLGIYSNPVNVQTL